MSLAYRVFLLHPDQTLYRVPHGTLTQLCAWTPELLLPEFANQRIRLAHVYVQMHNRLPTHVKQIEGQYIRFDARGAIDMKSLLDAELLTLQAIVKKDPRTTDASSNIIDARSRFERARCLWTPSPEIRDRIIDIALLRSHAKIFSIAAS
jgi:hypothetical protein